MTKPRLPPPEAAASVPSFTARVAASGAGAYLLGVAASMSHPVWASMSSLVVSPESFEATRRSIFGRILGTTAGATIAVTVGTIANPGASTRRRRSHFQSLHNGCCEKFRL
ncbi:MAG: FUSC family protein [Burkholderiaceae bacterium]|nr:FUSC family protein [Burkholderiaceae bacterium]